MAGETLVTIVGNLTADPELRFTQNGIAVANFTIASTPRNFDRQANEWKDGEALFMRCTAWRELGEHVAGSLTKGARVVAVGRLGQRSYQDREGNNRTSIELDVDEIGPSLRYATANVIKSAPHGGGRDQWASNQPTQAQRPGPQQDSWAVPQQDAWQSSSPYGDEQDIPF